MTAGALPTFNFVEICQPKKSADQVKENTKNNWPLTAVDNVVAFDSCVYENFNTFLLTIKMHNV